MGLEGVGLEVLVVGVEGLGVGDGVCVWGGVVVVVVVVDGGGGGGEGGVKRGRLHEHIPCQKKKNQTRLVLLTFQSTHNNETTTSVRQAIQKKSQHRVCFWWKGEICFHKESSWVKCPLL